VVRRNDEGEAQSRSERDRWTFYEAIHIAVDRMIILGYVFIIIFPPVADETEPFNLSFSRGSDETRISRKFLLEESKGTILSRESVLASGPPSSGVREWMGVFAFHRGWGPCLVDIQKTENEL
jgi:hypothetical protein